MNRVWKVLFILAVAILVCSGIGFFIGGVINNAVQHMGAVG